MDAYIGIGRDGPLYNIYVDGRIYLSIYHRYIHYIHVGIDRGEDRVSREM